MATNLKTITRGIGKLRGGLASKSGAKLKLKSFQASAQLGKNQLIFSGIISSEFPAQRSKQAKDQIASNKTKIRELELLLKSKNITASKKKEIRVKISQRKKNIATLQRSKDNAGSPAKQYAVSVIFGAVRFNNEKTSVFTKSVQSGSSLVWFKVPTVNTDIKLRCTCPDFRHNFSWPLAREKSLAVPVPQKYFRLTPAINGNPASVATYERPSNPKNPNPHGHDFVNPSDELGFCKHIFSFLQDLKNNGYLKEK